MTDQNITPTLKTTTAEACLPSTSHEIESNAQLTTNGNNKRSFLNDTSDQSVKRFCEASQTASTSQFTGQLPEMKPVLARWLLENIRQKYRELCGWTRRGFPGSHPVSMHGGNYKKIIQSPYMVSWKPAGKRYMMLIENRNKVYMLENGDYLFTVDHIQFPYDVECTSYLTDTLVDGELLIDNVDGSIKPQFLINDIIIYNGQNVSRKPFSDRLMLISQSIVNIRNEAIDKGYLKNTVESFSIRTKQFFGLSAVTRLLSPDFLETVPHKIEGLIFVPEKDPYTSGECPRVLKWKENEVIDFRLKISDNPSIIDTPPKKTAQLFLNNTDIPFATMPYSSNLQEYDNKIISCSYKDNQWYFDRLRPDRQFPNSQKTAMSTMEVLRKPVTREALCELINNQ